MPADGTTWYKMFAVTSIFSGLFSTTAENPAFGESQIVKSAAATDGVNGGMFTSVPTEGIKAYHANAEPWLEDGGPTKGQGGCLGDTRSGVGKLRRKLSHKKSLSSAAALDGGLTERGYTDGISRSKFSKVKRKLLLRKQPPTSIHLTSLRGPSTPPVPSPAVVDVASSNGDGHKTSVVDQRVEGNDNAISTTSSCEISPASNLVATSPTPDSVESSSRNSPVPDSVESSQHSPVPDSSSSRMKRGLTILNPKAWIKALRDGPRPQKKPIINHGPPIEAFPTYQEPLRAVPAVHQDSLEEALAMHHEALEVAPAVHHEAVAEAPAVHHEAVAEAPAVHHEAVGEAPAVPILCRGAPLGVAPAHQELVDMGFYGMDEAGVPAPGLKEDYDVEIPWGTDPRRIAFRHPDYGLVTLANAKQLMGRIDDPTTAAKVDLDKTLNRLAQTADFSLNMMRWANDGVDPECVEGEAFGVFPMRAESVRWHINGVVSRDGVGQGEEEWREYLAQREAAHSNKTQQNYDSDDDVLPFVGMATVCCKCQRRWDSGVQLGQPATPECRPITKLAKFYCKRCHASEPAGNGEVPLCMTCTHQCLKAREGYNVICGHPLGLRVRAKPGRAYKNAVDSTR